MTTTESRVREAFDKLSNLFIGTLNDITAIVIDAVPAEGQKTEAEVRGNLAGALGMPAETEWPELIAETDGRCRALGDMRAKLAAMTGRCRDLEMQREALQIGVAKDAARAASAEIERDALLKEKASLQEDIDSLMKSIREHDANEQRLRAKVDQLTLQAARVREDLAKEIAAHLEAKAKLKETEDRDANNEAGAAAVRSALGAKDGEQAIAAAERVAAELAAAQKEIADIKARPFEFLHGLGYRAPNGGGSITVSAVREFVDVVFDGPPGPESGRFVEVEDQQGKSISVGEWIDRKDGLWALRIPMRRPSRPSVAIEMLDDVREALGARSDETVLEAAARLRAQAQADAPDDPKDSDAPVAAFVFDGSPSNAVLRREPEKTAHAAIDRTRHDIVKLTPEEVEALRLPDTGMFHGEPGAWYRRGDGLFIGYADLVPDFEGPGGPVDSVMRRALSVIADLQERLKGYGQAPGRR